MCHEPELQADRFTIAAQLPPLSLRATCVRPSVPFDLKHVRLGAACHYTDLVVVPRREMARRLIGDHWPPLSSLGNLFCAWLLIQQPRRGRPLTGDAS